MHDSCKIKLFKNQPSDIKEFVDSEGRGETKRNQPKRRLCLENDDYSKGDDMKTSSIRKNGSISLRKKPKMSENRKKKIRRMPLISNVRRRSMVLPKKWHCEYCDSYKAVDDEKHEYKGGVTICTECLKKAEYGIRSKSLVDNEDLWTDDDWPKL